MSLLIPYLPLFKVALAFALMLAGIRFRLGLWQSILAGALALGLLFGLPLGSWPGVVLDGVFQAQSLRLAGIVGLIMVLSECMEKTGQAGRLLDTLTPRLRRPALRLVFFPILMGLLPMPGGAVFSAPMVRGASAGMPVGEKDRALVNYWFRHIWELAWPLYPGLILGASLAHLPVSQVVGAMAFSPLLMLLLGWWFILRPLPLAATPAPEDRPVPPLRQALREALPLITVIAGALGCEGLLAALGMDTGFELGVLAALVLAVAVCAAQNRGRFRSALRTIGYRHVGDMLLVVAAIFAFKETLLAAGVVRDLAGVAGGGAALLAATLILPFVMGFVSGINVAFVGSTFPLILAMLDQAGLAHQTLAYVVLGMYSGFTGVMVSPIHICLILTCQYFATPMPGAWPRLLAPCLLFLGFGLVLFRVLL
jgi:integral membrane protein (TIGR00529 family)